MAWTWLGPFCCCWCPCFCLCWVTLLWLQGKSSEFPKCALDGTTGEGRAHIAQNKISLAAHKVDFKCSVKTGQVLWISAILTDNKWAKRHRSSSENPFNDVKWQYFSSVIKLYRLPIIHLMAIIPKNTSTWSKYLQELQRNGNVWKVFAYTSYTFTNGTQKAVLPLVLLGFVASKPLTSVKALWRLRRNPKFLIFPITLQSFQNWIRLNEFLERESNSLSPFVAGPGINHKLYCCFLHCPGIQKYPGWWAAEEVLPGTGAVLSLPWIILMFDSAGPQLGRRRAGLLLSLLDCIGCFAVNGIDLARSSPHKLHISVCWGACYCFSMSPFAPEPPNLLPRAEDGPGEQMAEGRAWRKFRVGGSSQLESGCAT